MKIRKIFYTIDYIHILSFRSEYLSTIIPYFGRDNLSYGIENENTINESIRLVFKDDFIAMHVSKERISFTFEGDVADVKRTNGVIQIFFDIYEKIKQFKGYHKTVRHNIVVSAIDILDAKEVKKILEKNPFSAINVFKDVKEFSNIYEFEKDETYYNFRFGNYNSNDILKNDLTPFKTEYNKDLEGVGLISILEIKQKTQTASFNKFKDLLSDAENTISKYKI